MSNHNFDTKTENELSEEIERSFQYLQGNAQGALNSVGKILLVIEQRNKRLFKSVDRKNTRLTFWVFFLSLVSTIATVISIFR